MTIDLFVNKILRKRCKCEKFLREISFDDVSNFPLANRTMFSSLPNPYSAAIAAANVRIATVDQNTIFWPDRTKETKFVFLVGTRIDFQRGFPKFFGTSGFCVIAAVRAKIRYRHGRGDARLRFLTLVCQLKFRIKISARFFTRLRPFFTEIFRLWRRARLRPFFNETIRLRRRTRLGWKDLVLQIETCSWLTSKTRTDTGILRR